MSVRSVLMISGSTRSQSTNSAACRSAVTAAAAGTAVTAYLDVAALPHFNPDLDVEPVPAAVAELRTAIARADAVLFCTPEYAGTLPGSLKNLLDWTVGSTVLTDKPVGWLGVAADGRRGEGAHQTLASVLGYVQARVVADACRHVPIAREAVGADGTITDPDVLAGIGTAVAALLGGGA